MFRIKCYLAVAALTVVLYFIGGIAIAQQANAEIRAFWVDAWHSGFQSPSEVTLNVPADQIMIVQDGPGAAGTP